MLVEHPKVRFVSFTGSKAVGLLVNERAAKTPKEQPWLKRVVAEMGGKDATVIDSDCDLDQAVLGVAPGGLQFSRPKMFRMLAGHST